MRIQSISHACIFFRALSLFRHRSHYSSLPYFCCASILPSLKFSSASSRSLSSLPHLWTWTPHGTYFAVSVPPPFPFSKMLVPAQLTSPPALVPFPLEHVISLPAQSTAARTFCLRAALKAHLIMSASSQSYAPPAQSSTTHHCLPS